MRVFVTGATGFVGSAIIKDLVSAGHEVVGLARSEAAAKSLAKAGARVHRGSLEDLESLHSGAAAADGVIHTAFIHDFNNYAPAAEKDTRAIETLGTALAGSDRPFAVTSGTLLAQRKGALAMEGDAPSPTFPRKSETGSASDRHAGGARVGTAASAVGAWRRRSRLRPGSHQNRSRKGRFGLCR